MSTIDWIILSWVVVIPVIVVAGLLLATGVVSRRFGAQNRRPNLAELAVKLGMPNLLEAAAEPAARSTRSTARQSLGTDYLIDRRPAEVTDRVG